MRLIKTAELGGMMAYLILVKKHDPLNVYEFFFKLLYDDSPNNKMLAAFRKKLIKDLNATARISSVYRQQLIVKVWNAYIEGKEFTLMRWNEELEGKKDFK